jgi:hypothetical protein
MTTLLPQHDLAMLRAIARTASVLLVCLRIDQAHPGRAIADYEIADILEVDKRTVQKQLRSLSAAGLVIAVRRKWVVTMAGKNTLFGQARQVEGRDEAEEGNVQPRLVPETRVSGMDDGSMEAVSSEEPAADVDNLNYEKNAQNVYYEKNTQNVLNSHNRSEGAHKEAEIQVEKLNYEKNAQNVRLMNDDDDIKSFNDSDSSSSSINTRTNCAKILEATSLLFGSAVAAKNIADRDPDLALAWIGFAWNDRKTLRSPQGLIYKRLMEGERPPASWLEDPCYGLPEEYLRAIGRWTEPEAVEAVVETEPTPRRVAAWREVAGEMCGKIKFVAFHGLEESWWEGDVLQVAIRSERVVEFNRVAAGMAGGILSRMVGRAVQVQFVAMETEE